MKRLKTKANENVLRDLSPDRLLVFEDLYYANAGFDLNAGIRIGIWMKFRPA